MPIFEAVNLTDQQLQQLILKLLNPTEDFVPYRSGNIFQDSPVEFISAGPSLYSSIPVIYPRNVKNVSIEYNIIQKIDDIVNVTANSNAINLPIINLVKGENYTIKNSGIGTVPIVGTIDGDTARTLVQFEAIKIAWNGTNWMEIV